MYTSDVLMADARWVSNLHSPCSLSTVFGSQITSYGTCADASSGYSFHVATPSTVAVTVPAADGRLCTRDAEVHLQQA